MRDGRNGKRSTSACSVTPVRTRIVSHPGLHAGDDVGVHAVADHRGGLGVAADGVQRAAHHQRVRLADEVRLDARSPW